MKRYIEFDNRRILCGIVYHVTPSIAGIDNASVLKALEHSSYVTARIKRTKWRTMNDMARLGWLLRRINSYLTLDEETETISMNQATPNHRGFFDETKEL